MLPFNPQLKLSDAVYSDDKYLDHARLDKMRQSGAPERRDALNSQVIYAYGSQQDFGRQNFPLLWLTQGQGNKRAIESVDGVYYNWMFGKPKKTSQIARTLHDSGARTGADGEVVTFLFKDRFFQKNQIIYAGGIDGIQVQLGEAPKQEGSFWRYTGKIFGAKKGQIIPFQYLQQNYAWAGGIVKVSLARSRGTEHRSHAPFSTQNQISVVRHSFNLAGNIANKKLNFELVADGKRFLMWAEWERYLAELDFAEKRDIDLLISKYNKDAEGVVQNVDADSGEAVYSGMGLWDQIPSCNELPYTEMTEAKMSSYIDDILTITQQLDLVDKQKVVVDVMGGWGFLGEIDKALKRSTSMLTPMPSADLFINKDGKGGLEFGSYFTAYRHRSGVIFRFSHHRGFDYGALAESAPRHPLYPARSIMSFNAFIANFGLVNVDSSVSSTNKIGNIQFTYEKGREHVEKAVLGMSDLPGFDSQFAATDQDVSSWHMMGTQGINAMHPLSMGKITYQYSGL